MLAVIASACAPDPTPDHAGVEATEVTLDYLTMPLTREDSVDIIRAIWDVRVLPMRSRASRLLAQSATDSTMLPMSDTLRSLLTTAGIVLQLRPAVGDDTVVYRLLALDRQTAAVKVRLQSRWTTQIGMGARRCRTGSGNTETYLVQRESTGWRASRTGPVVHGDNACRPL